VLHFNSNTQGPAAAAGGMMHRNLVTGTLSESCVRIMVDTLLPRAMQKLGPCDHSQPTDMNPRLVTFDMLSLLLHNKSGGKITGITRAQREELERLERAVILKGLSKLPNLKALGVFGKPTHAMALKLQDDIDGREAGPLEFRIPPQWASHPESIMTCVATRERLCQTETMMLTMVLAAKDYEREDLPTVFRPVRLQLLADKAISDGLAEIRAEKAYGGIYETEEQRSHKFGGIDESEVQRKARAKVQFGGIDESEVQRKARADAGFGGIDEKEGQRGKSRPGHGAGTKHATPEDRAKMLLDHHYDTAFGSAKEVGKACNHIENLYRAEKGLPKRRSGMALSTAQNVFKEHRKLVQGMDEDEDD
jgi:hypothetical protein